MATPTYTALATTTLSSSASSVTFSSIPAGYRDLVCVINATASSGSQIICRFNADSGSNYSEVVMLGYSGGATSYTTSGTYLSQIFTGTVRTTSYFTVMDYSATDKHKTTLLRNAEGGTSTNATAGRWASTSAVTSILFDPETAGVTFDAGSTFSLYGIAS